MNPYEEKLGQFIQDKAMFEAVKGVLLSHCDLNQISVDHPKDELGDITMSYLRARDIILKSFKEIEKYQKSTPNPNLNVNGV